MKKIPISSNTTESELIGLSLQLREVKALNNLLVELLNETPEMLTYSNAHSFSVDSWPPILYYSMQAKLEVLIEKEEKVNNENFSKPLKLIDGLEFKI